MKKINEPLPENGAPKQSYRGYVRENLDRVESKIAFGHPHELIRQELNQEGGFESSLLTFRDALTRARRWKEARDRSLNSPPVVVSASKVMEASQAKPSPNSSINQPASSVDVDRYFKAPSLFRPKGAPHDKT
jgi:hypothetical protein